MRDWIETRLDSIAELLNHKRVPLNSIEREKRKGKYPYYGASGIVDYIDDYIFDGEYVLIAEDGENLNSRKTPIAFKVNGKFWVNNHAHILQGHSEFINDYIVYYFAALDLAPYITGAVQPKLSKESLLSIPIMLPKDQNELESIIQVLRSLDDKIDLLHRNNQTLEALAETFFRQWFEEEIGSTYDAKLADIAVIDNESINPLKFAEQFFYHYSIPAYDTGKQPVYEQGGNILSNKYIVRKGSILISKLNPQTPRVWAIGKGIKDAICSTEFQVVVPKEERYYSFLYFFLKSKSVTDTLTMAAGGTSGSHQRVKPEYILDLDLVKPDEQLLARFNLIANEILIKIQKNLDQIQTLSALRDTLLPKLMCG
ncbi:hypothetical protein JCM39194_20170 [Desulfotomaculum varum]